MAKAATLPINNMSLHKTLLACCHVQAVQTFCPTCRRVLRKAVNCDIQIYAGRCFQERSPSPAR